MEDLVIMHDQQAVTTSLQVAETFGKQHKNTIRDIESLLKSGGSKLSSQMFAVIKSAVTANLTSFSRVNSD